MRILVVGAGAIGGYFGGRLLEAGRDVTFLVRPKRAARLAETGLVIKSPLGDAVLTAPTLTAANLNQAYNLIILSCKAYDLESALDDLAPAVGPETAILPLLNGLRHLDLLDTRFGAGKVLGGTCLIAATVDEDGRILHLNDSHYIAFGERDGRRSERLDRVAEVMAGTNIKVETTDRILLKMWEKWVFLAALAGITCLMRASVGDIVASGGSALALDLLEECRAIAEKTGFPPRPAFLDHVRATMTAKGSDLTASMLRDMERGSAIEADHILGDLIRRAGDVSAPCSLLRLAYAHLKAYEARRAAGRLPGTRQG